MALRADRYSSWGRYEGTWHRRLQGEALSRVSCFQFHDWPDQLTNLAFFKHVSTSGGREEETCGCVAVAEASQFSWDRWISVMASVCKYLCDQPASSLRLSQNMRLFQVLMTIRWSSADVKYALALNVSYPSINTNDLILLFQLPFFSSTMLSEYCNVLPVAVSYSKYIWRQYRPPDFPTFSPGLSL